MAWVPGEVPGLGRTVSSGLAPFLALPTPTPGVSVRVKSRSGSPLLRKAHAVPDWKVGKPAVVGKAKGLRTVDIH